MLYLIGAVACARLQSGTVAWTHPTKSAQERTVDNARCMALAREAQLQEERDRALRSQDREPRFPPGTFQTPSMPTYINCMLSLGWSMPHESPPGAR